MQHVEDGNFKARFYRVSSVIGNEHMELAGLYSVFNQITSIGDWSLPMNLDGLVSSMLERLERLNPDIQELYTILSKSSRCTAEMTDESVIKKHLNSFLHNIGHLLRHKADSIAPVEEELQAVQKGLRFLRNFIGFAASGCSKLGKLEDLVIHAEIVAEDIACLLYLCCVNNKMDEQMINWMKLELLSQIQRNRPAQPEVRKIYVNTIKSLNSATGTAMTAEFVLGFLDSLREILWELSENNPRFSISVKDQMLSLHEELRFLECLVVDSSSEEYAGHDQKLKDLCERNNILIKEAACLIYSFYDDENDDMASQRNSLFYDLLAKIKNAKEDARQIYDKLVPKSLRSNFPRTNAQGFISSLLRNLKQLLSSKADSVASLKLHIEAVLDELQFLKYDFGKITKQPSEEEELEDQWTRFKDVAYQTEYVIDLFFATEGGIWFHKLGLFDVMEEIKTIRAEITHLKRKMADESKMLQNFPSFPSQISLQASPNDELVVFEPESERIKERLINGSEKLHILSIVGMPGIGKTTLANSIFQHASVHYHFHIRATCCVSQAHDTQRLQLEILQQVSSQTLDNSDKDLDHKLYQSLKGRRYLIFLDDIWDSELLENMRHSFPDDKNGSRIMLTSRLDNIVLHAGVESVIYHLSPLSYEKSWEMLQFKLFGKGSCPQELVEVGKDIAIGCRGLPLTIDLIVGVLREMENKQDCWEQLSQLLLTEFVDHPQGRCLKVLEISYSHLPYHLRPCFLYFAAFPEDMPIPARKLELLWIAEGFVQLQENDERSLEDIAQTYLDQLISRNLVMVTLRGSLGRVKMTHTHDLLREFAIVKASKEWFLLPIDVFSDFSTLSTSGYPWFEQYRLCIHPDYREQFFFSNPSGPRVRSLVFPSYLDRPPPTDKRVFEYPINLSNFRILRVFYLPDINIKHIPPSLLQLIHIRFLAIKTCEPEVFSEILHRLQNLETLIIMAGMHEGVNVKLCLKDTVNMARLRFLRRFEVCGFTFPLISQEIFEKQNPVGFENLQYLSNPFLYSGKDHHEKFMRRMPNLRKLKCLIESSRNLNPFPKLGFLKNLESLTIMAQLDREYKYPTTSMLSSSPYLKKLTLKCLYLPWTNISALGKLEHLEVLKLQFLKSSIDKWDMIEFDQQFPKLRHLQLAFLNIKEWNASEKDFPFLERLQVVFCEGLEMLPSCLADIPTLQEILLFRCSNSLGISAEEIKEQQVEQGNEQLVVRKMQTIDDADLDGYYDQEYLSDLHDWGDDPAAEKTIIQMKRRMNPEQDKS